MDKVLNLLLERLENTQVIIDGKIYFLVSQKTVDDLKKELSQSKEIDDKIISNKNKIYKRND